MKKLFALLLLVLLAGYCSLPLTSVASIRIALVDQSDRKITKGAASFLDADGGEIVTVALGALPSWDNTIHWWSHSSHQDSTLRPADARRARSAVISAPGCAPLTLPIELQGQYVPPSLSPHGGGRAYMFYEFDGTAKLDCNASG